GFKRVDTLKVKGPRLLDALEILQQPLDRILAAGPARGVQPRPAVERGDLDSRVLAERPHVGPGRRPPEARLRTCVLVVAPALLRGQPARLQQLELPPRQRAPQLGELVR